MTTLLTDGWLPRSDEERIAKDDAYEKARLIAWLIWYQSYEEGLLALEVLLRNAQRSLIKLGVDDFLRWKTLGLLVERALIAAPPKRSRGNRGQPEALRKIACDVLEMANRDGYPLNRNSMEQTAFEYTAEILANLGISVTPRQLEDWYYPPTK